MKNALIIINAFLVLAVGYLLYRQFSNTKPISALSTITSKSDSVLNKKLLFAYIDMDSIQQNYEVAKSAQREIKSRDAAISAELEKMAKAYQNKLAGYQQKAQTMTEAEANNARKDLEDSQNQIAEKRQSLYDQFNSFVANKNMYLKKNIEDYLKEFNADKTYSFIFAYEPGLFYYKDTAYDITNEVLKGLNQKLKAEKK